jgi:hypothetical protein
MSDVPLHDVGHQNAPARDELLAASAIIQFYTFASRCMEWANTTRSLQERGEEFGAVKKRSVGKLTRKSVMSQGK